MTDERAPGEPTHFEVQYQPHEGAHWHPVGPSTEYDAALAARDEMAAAESKGKFRVQPAGTGPNDVPPTTRDHEVLRTAFGILSRRVARDGGRVEDIYRHGNSFRWRAPANYPLHPGKTVSMGWSHG